MLRLDTLVIVDKLTQEPPRSELSAYVNAMDTYLYPKLKQMTQLTLKAFTQEWLAFEQEYFLKFGEAAGEFTERLLNESVSSDERTQVAFARYVQIDN